MGCVSGKQKPKSSPALPEGHKRFEIGQAFLNPVLSRYPSPGTYQSRIRKWKRCEQKHSSLSTFYQSDRALFIRRLFKGPPTEYRGQAWLVVSNWSSNSGLYEELLTQSLDPDVEIAIQKDLDRTYPHIEYFKTDGRKALEDVLKAFAIWEPDIGYVQGLNFIAGLLLMVMGGDAKQAFWLLRHLSRTLKLKGLFTENLPKLLELVEMFHKAMELMLPQLRRAFETEGINDGIWVTKWMLSLYSFVLPLYLVVRIWDVFLVQGPDFLVRVGLTLLKRNKYHLLHSNCDQICTRLQTLGLEEEVNPDLIVLKALRLRLPHEVRTRTLTLTEVREDEEQGNATSEVPHRSSLT